MISNYALTLAGICFVMVFNFFYDFIMDEDRRYRPFILWNLVLHLILFTGNFYLFFQPQKDVLTMSDGNALMLLVGNAFGYFVAKYYGRLMKKGKFMFINILNFVFIGITLLFAYLNFS